MTDFSTLQPGNIQILVVIISSFMIHLICVIIGIHCNIQLHRYRECMFMTKRNLSVVYGLNIALIMKMITCGITESCIFIIQPLIWKGIAYCLHFLAWWLCLWFLITKNWILFFKSKWTHYTLQYHWQQLINSNRAIYQHQSNWFIRNNNKYGKISIMLLIFGIICFIGWLITCYGIILIIWTNKHQIMLQLSISMIIIIFFIVILFYIIIVFKTPSFDDAFYIHSENRLHAIIMLIIMMLFLTINALNIFYPISMIYTSCIIWPIISILLCIMIYLSTLCVIGKNKANRLPLQLINTNSNKSNSRRRVNITLDMVLKHKKAFHRFMLHLSKEFSMECLLSYIEFTQYQQYLIKENYDRFHSRKHRDTLTKIYLIDLPTNIPISALIEHKTDNEVQNGHSINNGDPLPIIHGALSHSMPISPTSLSQNTLSPRSRNGHNAFNTIPIPMETYREESPSIHSTNSSPLTDPEDDEYKTNIFKYKLTAHQIYEKYVKTSSEFEINISSSQRLMIANVLNDAYQLLYGDKANIIGLDELLLIFEDSKCTMLELMQFAYARFKKTKEFEKVIQIFGD